MTPQELFELVHNAPNVTWNMDPAGKIRAVVEDSLGSPRLLCPLTAGYYVRTSLVCWLTHWPNCAMELDMDPQEARQIANAADNVDCSPYREEVLCLLRKQVRNFTTHSLVPMKEKKPWD